MGLFLASYLALTVGIGVYLSCTRYRGIMKAALILDAICALGIIAIGRWDGAW